MILGTEQNWSHNFWSTTQISIEFTSLVLETNLGNALEKKRAGGDLSGPVAQHGCGHTRVTTAQHGPRPEGPRALVFCKRTPKLIGYYAAPLITIARESCFA